MGWIILIAGLVPVVALFEFATGPLGWSGVVSAAVAGLVSWFWAMLFWPDTGKDGVGSTADHGGSFSFSDDEDRRININGLPVNSNGIDTFGNTYGSSFHDDI